MLRFVISGILLASATIANSQDAAAPAGGTSGGSMFPKAVCKQGPNTRRVEVEPGETDTKHSCQVRYFKDQEAPGEGKVLWSAANSEGFCSEKAKGFVAKLTGMGWACEGDLVSK